MPVRGWRRFEIYKHEGNWALRGMRMPWEAPQMTAECLAPYFHDPLDPYAEPVEPPQDADRHAICVAHLWDLEDEWHVGFGCGIYIVPEQRHLEPATHGFGSVEVQTIGWGAVAEYDVGWRVEKARMEHILIDPHSAQRRLDAMGVKPTIHEVDKMFSDLGYRYGVYVSWLER